MPASVRPRVRLPANDEAGLPRRQLTVHDSPMLNRHLHLVFCVLGMKVRRGVIADVHLDDDAAEAAQLRHLPRPAGPA